MAPHLASGTRSCQSNKPTENQSGWRGRPVGGKGRLEALEVQEESGYARSLDKTAVKDWVMEIREASHLSHAGRANLRPDQAWGKAKAKR
jgi:hypothetical protein